MYQIYKASKNSFLKLTCYIAYIFVASYIILILLNLYLFEISLFRSHWGYGEFFINYSEGFVRRGLFGEYIREMILHNQSYLDIIIISTIILILLLKLQIINEYSIQIKILTIFLPSGLVFFFTDQIAQQNFFRKEIFYYFYFVCFLYFAIFFLNKKEFNRFKIKYIYFFFFNNFILILFLFFHESSLFLITPSILLVLFCLNKIYSLNYLNSFLKIFFIIQIIVFFTIIFFDYSEVSIKLLEAYSEKKFSGNYFGPLKSLSWSFYDHINLTISVWPYLLVSLLNFIFFYFIYTFGFFIFLFSSGENINKNINLNHYIFITFYIMVTTSPMFLFGWDYGRWYFSIFYHTILLFILLKKIYYCNFERLLNSGNFLVSFINFNNNKRRILFLFLFAFSVQVNFGHCCGNLIKFDRLIVIGKNIESLLINLNVLNN